MKDKERRQNKKYKTKENKKYPYKRRRIQNNKRSVLVDKNESNKTCL